MNIMQQTVINFIRACDSGDIKVQNKFASEEEAYEALVMKQISADIYEKFPMITTLEQFLHTLGECPVYIYTENSLLKTHTCVASFSLVTQDDTICEFVPYEQRITLTKLNGVLSLVVKTASQDIVSYSTMEEITNKLLGTFTRHAKTSLLLVGRPCVENVTLLKPLRLFLKEYLDLRNNKL